MSEAKLRLVRCPKCQNLLQELPDYSIYQCGGCGAVLRAKKGKLEVNYGSKRFDEERLDVISPESENFREKNLVSGVDNQEIGNDSKPEIGKRDVLDENSSGNHQVGNMNFGSKSDKRETLIENSSQFSRSGRFVEEQRGRFSSSNSLNFDSSYQNQASRSTRPEITDHEREELLRKLDELKDQIIRVQTINGKAPEATPFYPRTVEYDHQSRFHRIPSQLSTYSNSHVSRPPYFENYPTSMRSLDHVHRYEDPIEPQRNPSHYRRFMSLEPSPSPYEPHQCLCHQCFARQIPAPSLKNQRFYHDHDPQPNLRKLSKLKSEVDRSVVPRVFPRRMSFCKENRNHCFPVAGGTPFVTCRNCFKLLKLPKKMYICNKDEWRMSCGSCSFVISFAIVDEKLVSVGNGQASQNNASFSSEDYANTVYDVREMDKQRVSSSSFQEDVSTSKSEEMNNCSVSSTTTTNEDEQFRDGSPPRDSFDYASTYRAINRGGKGSVSSRIVDNERITTNKTTLRGSSLRGSLASEMETPLDDYDELQDSVNNQQKAKKGIDSFLAGIIKKSFKDLSGRSSQTTGSGKRNVTVNGHLILDRLVKKAEKLAGPIHPGNYWYDYRAGFWGVIGGSCLGIIPSNIQEFNYPMPEKCAGGNTGVLVNGRELHQKDLDLLTSRGLPAATDKSYILDISGRVADAYSGKELVNLGKLAPTVEKLRCGFGMRAPEAAA